MMRAPRNSIGEPGRSPLEALVRKPAVGIRFTMLWLFAGLVMCISAAQAQSTAATTGQEYGAWTLNCRSAETGQDQRCVLIQEVPDPETKETFMQVAIGYFGNDQKRGALIALPLGVALPPGLEVRVDERKVGAGPFAQCTQGGCQAHFLLTEERLTAFKQGLEAKVMFKTMQGKTVGVPFSLKGFTAGFGQVTQ